MDIKYEIEPVFKIEFFKIECINFKKKKKKLEKALSRYPEMPFLILKVIEINVVLIQNLEKYLKMNLV